MPVIASKNSELSERTPKGFSATYRSRLHHIKEEKLIQPFCCPIERRL
jgi:hypothetical protein